MSEESVALKIADGKAAIRFMGEMHSRGIDPIHEPIQNLIDAGAKQIDVFLDRDKNQIRISGNSEPITSKEEMKRIMRSICLSDKKGDVVMLGEKGLGMLSFMAVGDSMTMTSVSGGESVYMSINKNKLDDGKVGTGGSIGLPYPGTECKIKGVNPKNLKHRFSDDNVIRDIKRRWGGFFQRGIDITVNGKDVASTMPVVVGDEFKRTIKLKSLGQGKEIVVDLLVLKDPSDTTVVSVTHKGQANFSIHNVPMFERNNAFTQGMVHGTITGDAVPINASRTGFQETEKSFDVWSDAIIEIESELGKVIEDRVKASAEGKDAETLTNWMLHLKGIFKGTELESTTTSDGKGGGESDEGWEETKDGPGRHHHNGKGGGDGGPSVGDKPRAGGPGRLPTVPYAGFTKAPPNIRVTRDRKAFHINVLHPDYIAAAKSKNCRRSYLKEVCMHEAYAYSLEGEQRKWYEDRSDEFLTHWTRAHVKHREA